MTAVLGYARVSTTGQHREAQLGVLTAAGVDADRIFADKFSGAVGTDRLDLAALLNFAREGDTAVVTAVDRLGRSVTEVARTCFRSVDQHRGHSCSPELSPAPLG